MCDVIFRNISLSTSDPNESWFLITLDDQLRRLVELPRKFCNLVRTGVFPTLELLCFHS